MICLYLPQSASALHPTQEQWCQWKNSKLLKIQRLCCMNITNFFISIEILGRIQKYVFHANKSNFMQYTSVYFNFYCKHCKLFKKCIYSFLCLSLIQINGEGNLRGHKKNVHFFHCWPVRNFFQFSTLINPSQSKLVLCYKNISLN